tara:strand:+ start:2752 stop:4518 length:1767 start_codon:yes stop_codon:yes gene_type:complete
MQNFKINNNEIIEFKLPINYLKNVYELNDTLINDLELKKFNNIDDNIDKKTSVYDYIYNPTCNFSKNTMNKSINYFTNNTKYLKDTQKLLITYNDNSEYNEKDSIKENDICNNIIEKSWNEIRNNKSFIDKYHYINVNFLKIFNYNSIFLHFLSLYNIASPFISIVLPIFILIIPYFILKLQGKVINFSTYKELLYIIIQKQSVGKLLFNFANSSLDKKIQALFCIIFYFLQIWNNFHVCISFYKNMNYVSNQICLFKNYLNFTVKKIDNYISYSNYLKTYQPFNNDLNYVKSNINNYLKKLNIVKNHKYNLFNLNQIGLLMSQYYNIYDCINTQNLFMYCFNFNGYIENIIKLQELISNKYINKCNFYKKNTKFNNMFYPPLLKENPIKNSYNLNNNMIITGPNASGKTTLLKSTLINLILSQQLGFGFYKNAAINPYKYIHCYINIPDTSGRDSLFQAEVRRCKDILNIIDKNNKYRHFCIFDELYSGTNPYEAVSCAQSYLKYISKNRNVDLMLTTHYIDLCKNLDNEKYIDNYHMKINKNENAFVYTYLLNKKISTFKGGIKILKDFDYPKEIIDESESIINNY